MTKGEVTGLILAAGGSTRFGRPKQLISMHGVPLIRRVTLVALRSPCSRIVVVVGAYRDKVIDVIADLDVSHVANPQWQEGIGSSVRSGVAHILTCAPASRAILILPVDQVQIGAPHLTSLIEAFWRHGKIIASQYNHTLGVPVLFPHWCFKELLCLSGDSGAKALLTKYPQQVFPFPCPEAAYDVDTPEDLQKLQGPFIY